VWRAPPGRRLLSNAGAAAEVRRLPLEWERCCDDNGDATAIRTVTEPRPVFARGQLYYLVSVVPINDLVTVQPVDRTVLIDAAERAVVDQYDHADPEAGARLQAFFRRSAEPARRSRPRD
jgi:hypothetical protein